MNAFQSYPKSTSIAYTYNATDQVTQVTDAAGNVIADTFDALGRNTARSVTKATGFVDTTSETRAFDAVTRASPGDDGAAPRGASLPRRPRAPHGTTCAPC